MLGENIQQIQTMKDKFPAWVAIVCIAGRTELPEERVVFLEKDIREIAREFGLELKEQINGVDGAQALKIVLNPSREPYWKFGYKGGCHDVFFVVTLDMASELAEKMNNLAETLGYPSSDIGVYIQPRHQGVNVHCEFNLPYNPNNPQESARVRNLYLKASEALINWGAFFTRPYGIWADLAFQQDEPSARLLRHIKGVFDPKGIMNPGKLCFKVE
jgi:glycolate oxidase